jgi:hypothetical protein
LVVGGGGFEDGDGLEAILAGMGNDEGGDEHAAMSWERWGRQLTSPALTGRRRGNGGNRLREQALEGGEE